MTKRRVIRVDLRNASFSDWLDFVFKHPPPTRRLEEWYFTHDLEIDISPEHQVSQLTRLFERPGILRTRFSTAQIEQGFWFMFGGGGDGWHRQVLWNPTVSWSRRNRLIRAIPTLYRTLFSRVTLDTIPFMLWDMLADEYGFGIRHPRRNLEDRRVQQSMFLALTAQLRSGTVQAQLAALHGIHHLAHPKGLQLIRKALRTKRSSRTVRQYAENVLAGHAT